MSKDAKQKQGIDWIAIEREYNVGIKSLRGLASEFGGTEGAIRKRIKRDGWKRDHFVEPKQSVGPKQKKVKVVLAPIDEWLTSGFVYVIYSDCATERRYKIGMAKKFKERLGQHQCSCPSEIFAAIVYFVGNMRAEETALHRHFADKRIRGEWFRLTDDDLIGIAKRSLLV
jgi:hypothetical protein